MTIELEKLDDQPRLLMKAELKPVQGTRFQPTGFPDLGAASYQAPGTNGQPIDVVLVESAQSMANRLEAVCWDKAEEQITPALNGMPYVHIDLWNGEDSTNSILEPHRLNSPYILESDDTSVLDTAEVPSCGS